MKQRPVLSASRTTSKRRSDRALGLFIGICIITCVSSPAEAQKVRKYEPQQAAHTPFPECDLNNQEPEAQDSLRNLLIPLSDKEIQDRALEDIYFVRKNLYFSKRHRFVLLDHCVMASDERFRINLFPDTVLVVQAARKEGGGNSVLVWKGDIIDPPLPDGWGEGIAEDFKRILIEDMLVTMVGVPYDLDTNTGRAFATRSQRNQQGYKRPDDRTTMMYSAFYGFATWFSGPPVPGTFRMHAIDTAPDVHLVYEMDPDKELRHFSTNPKYEERQARYENFVESLGEDPSIEWRARHRGEID